ncbi:unnamed protein product [Tetraodon nigroviridis]|uniref:(spotted green pufferfish) hypothetical protein n=1 Tax=Tetraodon nigroviridis TaxID=99883 RepID=Q4REZ7_TETNG|nr:unnamed protein product [Tetraodon nigroviridis]
MSEEQVWYIRQYMTEHKHQNNFQSLHKKNKKISIIYTSAVKNLHESSSTPCALSWRREANQINTFHIHVIYDRSTAQIIYLQCVSGENESFQL